MTEVLTETTGDLGGKFVDLGVDEEDMGHIMNLLSDQYKDGILAIIREYSTNALDSHIMAGNDDPITVTLPNTLMPFLIVEDKGLGLTYEDMTLMYGRYGKSRKRGDAKTNGRLGIGAKSALTYTDAFNIRAIKDGKLCEVMIYRTELGGRLEVVEERDTDEPNGVRIKIAVTQLDDLKSFRKKAEKLFSVWDRGTVNLIGGEITHVKDIGWKLMDNTWVAPGNGRVYFVMGNVPYEHGQTSDMGLGHQVNVYHFVGTDEISFHPSREMLQLDYKTEQFLKNSVITKFDVNRYVSDRLKVVRDPAEAYRLAGQYDNDFIGVSRENLTYQSMTMEKSVTLVKDRFYDLDAKRYRPLDGIVWSHAGPGYAYMDLPEGERFTAKLREQIAIATEGTNIEGIITSPLTRRQRYSNHRKDERRSYILDSWIPILDFDEVSAIVVPENRMPKRKPRGFVPDYDFRAADGSYHKNKPVPDTDKLMYTSGYTPTGSLEEGYTIVHLSDNRIAKFLRNFPHAIKHEEFEKLMRAKLPKPNKSDLWFDGLDHAVVNMAKMLYAEGVRDREITKIAKHDPKGFRALQDQYREKGVTPPFAEGTSKHTLYDRFPLLAYMGYASKGSKKAKATADYVKLVKSEEKK